MRAHAVACGDVVQVAAVESRRLSSARAGEVRGGRLCADPARKCSREPALPALSKGTCHRANVDSMTCPWKRGKQAGLWAVPIDAAIVSMRHCTRLRHIHVNSMQQQPRVMNSAQSMKSWKTPRRNKALKRVQFIIQELQHGFSE
jgi:hypothetical protein